MRGSQNCRLVGRVVGLWRYPIKSMAGQPLSEVAVSWHGFAGDRRWALIRNGVTSSGFPWLTLRDREDMCHYCPSFADPAKPDHSPVIVRTPSGAVYDVMDAALAAELYPLGAWVIKQDRGIFDTFPLFLITTQSISALGDLAGFRVQLIYEHGNCHGARIASPRHPAAGQRPGPVRSVGRRPAPVLSEPGHGAVEFAPAGVSAH